MKLLLAGGCGYIGTMLAPYLADRGYEVEVADLLWFGNFLPKEIKVYQKDLWECDIDFLEGYDQILFLGGISNDPMADLSPQRNWILNAALPAYLAWVAKKAGVRKYIFASSCSIYGYTLNKMFTEQDPVVCDYPYGISKMQGESGVWQIQDDKFSVISLRQGTISGHSPRMRFDLIVNTMFKTAMTEGKIIVNDPALWRPIVDLRDIVKAWTRAVEAHPTVNGSFNIATANYTVGQVGDLVREKLKKKFKDVRLEVRNIPDMRNYAVSCEKAKNMLGFTPQSSVAEIVDDLYNHLEYYGDFTDPNFYNIQIFKKLVKEGKV